MTRTDAGPTTAASAIASSRTGNDSAQVGQPHEQALEREADPAAAERERHARRAGEAPRPPRPAGRGTVEMRFAVSAIDSEVRAPNSSRLR